jgi:alkanesulfonate monooxygenase SsuD/methylene tetrahydromethanopterin reductase-like flavin-dependent oxidoreductase (luciferase family)
MLGVPTGERAQRVTEVVKTLRAAFTGEPFEHRGRTVRLTPAPFRDGLSITLGGSGEAAARRAARIADGFIPAVPEAWDFYRDEVQALGRPDPGPNPMPPSRTVALAEDPEKAWDQMGPFFLHEMNAYGGLLAANDGGGPYHPVEDLDELRAAGGYAILTPDEYIDELRAAPFPFAMFHPLCGGITPDLAWASLRLFEHEVMPAFD